MADKRILIDSQRRVISSGGNAFTMDIPAVLEVGATTIHTDASHTANIASNDCCRIYGSDGRKYTIAEWNYIFSLCLYNKDNMPIQPLGIALDAFGHKGEVLLFDRYYGQIYNCVGDAKGTQGCLNGIMYNQPIVSVNNAAARSGTDYATGKGWTVTADGNEYVLGEANTGQSWRISNDVAYKTIAGSAYNIHERTYSIWARTEWMRHRMAIDSGLTTTLADGTYGQIEIFNSSGVQAAVGEDMYFFIRATSSDTWTNTNILAKYNLNNQHKTNKYYLTQAIADAIYARHKANGINMNDTGVNSSTKPILCTGAKGAEVIAKDGKWMIITPYVTYPSATTTTAAYNIIDSPAYYWAMSKGYDLPSDRFLFSIHLNSTLVAAIMGYLTNVESRSLTPLIFNTIWSCIQQGDAYTWYSNTNTGIWSNNTVNKYYIYGAKQTEP